MKLHALLLTAAFLAVPAIDAFAQAHGTAPAAEAKPAQPAKPDPARGEARFSATCVACHGAGGNSSIAGNPKLAQQHPEYIVKQLQDFKDGKRKNAVMQGMAAPLSEQDMRDIAAYVHSNKAKPGFAKDKDLVAAGERIWRGGIADRQVPACASCHSPNGAGIPAQYPRLAGQHADYVSAQLIAFRDGVRKNSRTMADVAAKMNDREIRAVADYIAGLR